MSVDAKIRTALTALKVPAENAIYQGNAKTYFVFSYTTIPDAHADDVAQAERYLISVSLFAPLSGNITTLVKQTKNALYKAGCTWPSTTNLTDENGRHIVFECEIAEGTEFDELV